MTVLGRTLVVAGALLLVGAAPAAADPAKPTDYRSRIDSVEPAVDGVRLAIVGGDAFLRLSVDRGHTVTVEGYSGEPYLQVLGDGTVQENLRSEATYLNEDRYGRRGEVEVPAGIAPEDEPEWRTVADDGEYAWHDHRIHWMSPDRPDGVEPGEIVQTQPVPLVVDGEEVTVTVSVVLEHGISPVPWLGLGLLAAAGAVAVGWRRRSLAVALGAAALATVLAVVAGQGEYASVPSDAGGTPLVVVVPLVGLAATAAGGLLLARRKAAFAGIALLAAAATLAGWALLRLSVLWKPVLPTDLPANLDRAATALAVALGAAVAALTVHSGAITPAPVTDEVDDRDDREGTTTD